MQVGCQATQPSFTEQGNATDKQQVIMLERENDGVSRTRRQRYIVALQAAGAALKPPSRRLKGIGED